MSADDTTRAGEEQEEFHVEAAAAGQRLDVCLAARFRSRSRAFLQRCIREKRVLRNGQFCRPADKVEADDLVRLTWPEPPSGVMRGEAMDLEVLWEDEDVLVINKPPHLVVHPAHAHPTGTLVHGLLHYDRDQFSELVDADRRPGIVHRLDRDTSGVLVVARTRTAWTVLKLAFAAREVEKIYLALVLGEFGAVSGRIEAPIGRSPRNPTRMAVLQEGGKRAATRYRVLGQKHGITLLEIQIETGRTHQIRVHFAHLHHPVLGDSLYGGRQKNAPFAARRQMLHAWKLAFPHPRTGVVRQYMAPVPDDFQEALRALELPALAPAATARVPDFPEDRDAAPDT